MPILKGSHIETKNGKGQQLVSARSECFVQSVGFTLASVPQGSLLGPLSFLVFINDIVDIVHSNIKLFADDTSLYLTIDNPITAAASLNTNLASINNIYKWSKDWRVSFNALKTDSHDFVLNNYMMEDRSVIW